MRVWKYIGAVLVSAASAAVLAVSGLGAAYATAAPAVEVDAPVVEVEDVVHHNHNLIYVFAPITIVDVLNDVNVLSVVDVLND